MNRLRILKQRAARGGSSALRLSDGWFAAHGNGWGDCAGPMSRREAIYLAARWAMPRRHIHIVVTFS